MMIRFVLTACAAATAFLASSAFAAAPRPIVVELFTSQGCSSCPPADEFLSDLADTRQDLLPLAFHITYWNQLGWRDPYSLDISTERQARYGQRFGDGSYTPEMVIDGKVGVVGSDRDAAHAAIERAKASDVTAAALSAVRSGDGVSVSVGNGSGRARVLLVGYDARRVTPIGRGENAGRTLTESNIVRGFMSIGEWSGTALKLDAKAVLGEQLAVLLEAPDGTIVGAARVADAPGGVAQ